MKIEHIKKMSKPTSTENPETSKAAQKQCSGKVPYCWRCYTKGHGASDCHVIMYCPICDCNEHTKICCPKWRADKPMALTCGYAG
jgi:hypothetical protein